MKTSYFATFSARPVSKTVSAVLVYLSYGVLFLLFAGLASVVSPDLIQPTQTGKTFIFAFAMVCIMSLLLIHKFFTSNSMAIRLTAIDILVGALLLYISMNRYLLQETWGFSLGYYELIGLGILYSLLRQTDKKIYPWLFVAVIVSGIIQAVYGNLQLYGFYSSHHSGFKMTGSFFNPGPYAGFLSTVFPVAFGVYLFKGSIFQVLGLKFHVFGSKTYTSTQNGSLYKKPKIINLKNLLLEWLPLVTVFSIIMVLPASQSRAAWLAAGVAGVFLLAKKYQWTGRTANVLNSFIRKITVVLLLIFLSAAIAYTLYLFKPGSANGRLLIWKVTANMFMDSPWIGHGFDRFKTGYMNYQATYFQNNLDNQDVVLADNVYYAFNEPLQFAAENGSMGFAILIALLLVIFTSKSVQNEHLLQIVKAGLISLIVFSFFSYPTQILPIKLIAILFLATAATVKNSFIWDLKYPNWGGSLSLRGLATGIVAIGMAGAIMVLSDLRKGYKDWATADELYQIGQYDQSLELYEKASIQFPGEGDFLMDYGKALSIAEKHEKAVETLEHAKGHLNTTIIETALGDSYKALKKYKAAETAYYNAWYMAPSRFYPKYLLAKLYDENNQPQKARNIALELMEKEVKVESMAIEEIKAEMEIIINKSSS